MIRLDSSPASTVAVCSLCPWRHQAHDRVTALARAAAHDRNVHDSPAALRALHAALARRRNNGAGGLAAE